MSRVGEADVQVQVLINARLAHTSLVRTMGASYRKAQVLSMVLTFIEKWRIPFTAMTSDGKQKTLASVWYEFFAREVQQNPRETTEWVIQRLVEELRASAEHLEDAVVYTMARTIDGGTIAQLTHDVDPGFVNRVVGATEGFYPRDYCFATRRKRCGVASAVRTFEPVAFLARDPTGTLAERSRAFEAAFIALLQEKLAD